jgi:hypothetical protein
VRGVWSLAFWSAPLNRTASANMPVWARGGGGRGVHDVICCSAGAAAGAAAWTHALVTCFPPLPAAVLLQGNRGAALQQRLVVASGSCGRITVVVTRLQLWATLWCPKPQKGT